MIDILSQNPYNIKMVHLLLLVLMMVKLVIMAN